MAPRSTRVVLLPKDPGTHVVEVLSDAFQDYPVMRYVLGKDAPDYAKHLRSLVGLFVGARTSRGDPILAVEEDGRPVAVATLTVPSGEHRGSQWQDVRRTVWEELGEDALARYQAFVEACATFSIPEPHYHLNMIGVRREFQGRGLARMLLDEVHRLSRDAAKSCGVSLTTEDAANVILYQHVGYHVVSTAQVAPGFQSWGLFRPDSRV